MYCQVLMILGGLGVHRAIPNDVVRAKLTVWMYRLGVALTLGMSRHPRVVPVWKKTVEPFVVDAIDNVSYAVSNGLVKGLRSGDVAKVRDASTQTGPE
jgi:hypothetical protein